MKADKYDTKDQIIAILVGLPLLLVWLIHRVLYLSILGINIACSWYVGYVFNFFWFKLLGNDLLTYSPNFGEGGAVPKYFLSPYQVRNIWEVETK